MDPLLLRIWLGALAIVICFLPAAIYLMLLAVLNHRRHPTLIQGSWDFVGLLLGLSGFLLVGGTVLLSSLTHSLRLFWQRGDLHRLQQDFQELGSTWVILWLLYCAGVVGGLLVLIRYRRHFSVVYNVRRDQLDDAFCHTLNRLGLRWERLVHRWSAESVNVDASQRSSLLLQGIAVWEIDWLPSSHHATIRWEQYDPPLRRAIEAELALALRKVPSEGNAAAGWLLTASAACFGIVLFVVGMMMIWMLSVR